MDDLENPDIQMVALLHRDVAQVVWDCCQWSVNSNFLPPKASNIAKWGPCLLRYSKWGALASDKYGVFVLLPRQQIFLMKRSILQGPNYEPVALSTEILKERAASYKEACLDVAAATYPLPPAADGDGRKEIRRLRGELVQTLLSERQLVWRLASQLDRHIKTHKPSGAVVPRPIHASHRHIFDPGQRWLCSILREAMSSYGRLLRDSDHLIANLSSCRFNHHDKIIVAWLTFKFNLPVC